MAITDLVFKSNGEREAEGYVQLGSIDEDEDYGIDEHTIMRAPDGTFLLRTASGCSCWDGDYDEEAFPTLEALETELMEGATRGRPSLKGAEQLMTEVRATLARGAR